MLWHQLYAILWGATWGNNVAEAEAAIAGLVLAYVFRDHIGKHAAAWWAKHHGQHAIAQHREALRQHEESKGDHHA